MVNPQGDPIQTLVTNQVIISPAEQNVAGDTFNGHIIAQGATAQGTFILVVDDKGVQTLVPPSYNLETYGY